MLGQQSRLQPNPSPHPHPHPHPNPNPNPRVPPRTAAGRAVQPERPRGPVEGVRDLEARRAAVVLRRQPAHLQPRHPAVRQLRVVEVPAVVEARAGAGGAGRSAPWWQESDPPAGHGGSNGWQAAAGRGSGPLVQPGSRARRPGTPPWRRTRQHDANLPGFSEPSLTTSSRGGPKWRQQPAPVVKAATANMASSSTSSVNDVQRQVDEVKGVMCALAPPLACAGTRRRSRARPPPRARLRPAQAAERRHHAAEPGQDGGA